VLGELLSSFDIFALLLGLTGALMIVLGTHSDEGDIAEKSPWLYVALAANPVLIAFGEVALRKMRKLPATTVMCYTSYALLICSLVMMYVKEESFDFFADLDLISQLLVSSLVVVNMLA